MLTATNKNLLTNLSDFIRCNLTKIKVSFYYNSKPDYNRTIVFSDVLSTHSFSGDLEIKVRFRDDESLNNLSFHIKPVLELSDRVDKESADRLNSLLSVYLVADIYTKVDNKYLFTIDLCKDSTYKIETLTKHSETKVDKVLINGNNPCIFNSTDERVEYKIVLTK